MFYRAIAEPRAARMRRARALGALAAVAFAIGAIAGERDTTVEDQGRAPGLAAQPVVFDASNDVAVLRVPGLGLPSLDLAVDPPSSVPGAILGYPENGPFHASPGRIGRTQVVLTQDAYGRGPISRLLTPLVGVVHAGNSGGPLVGADGHVLTTVFAGTIGGAAPGGYGVANSTVASALARAKPRASAGLRVGTQACAAG